jgi:hypothetical protein
MALSAREQLYEILTHWTLDAASTDAAEPKWGDDVFGHDERNIIADAEMMLCFLAPTFQLDSFSLAKINDVADGGLQRALENFSKRDVGGVTSRGTYPVPGSAVKNYISERIRSFVTVPLESAFAPGAYVTGAEDGGDTVVPNLKVVDAYTLTVSVCVQAMYLLTSWIDHEEHSESPEAAGPAKMSRASFVETRGLCSERLTIALLGLVRSFAVKSYDKDVGADAPGGWGSSREWERKNRRAWPGEGFGWSSDVLATVRRRLGARPEYKALLRGDDIPFACGFSWGPISDSFWGDDQMPDAATEYPTFADGETEAWAVDAPYLYFTITAIEGVADLLATKIRSANILNRDQSYLAAQLGFLVENTTLYWRALAFAPRMRSKRSEDSEGWYLERLPWRTSDADRDDYYSLYVIGLILGAREQLLNAAELGRIIMLLEELAQRGRITREPYIFGDANAADAALQMHYPGKPLTLDYATGIDGLQQYVWTVDDFAPKLLKLAGIAAQRADDPGLRRRALRLADEVWEKNLKHRRFAKHVRGGSVWDIPLKSYTVMPELWDGHDPGDDAELVDAEVDGAGLEERYSWHMTQRVAEALVAVTRGQERSTTSGEQMRVMTEEILDSLAERGSALDEYRAQMSEAEDRLRAEEPSRALQEALSVLRDVEARESANGQPVR